MASRFLSTRFIPHRWFEAPRKVVIDTLSILLFGHIFFTYGYGCGLCYGVSMVPTLDPIGTLVFTSKRYRRGRGIQVGDLVSFDHPVKHGRGLKRVVGMPGDFVLRDTPGVGEPGHEMMIQVPKGHCYIAGDNLKYSRDSRMFGPLPLALIRGKVVAGLRFGADTGYIPEFQRYGGALKEVN